MNKATSSNSSTIASFTNCFRPHRGEAVVRLRSNAFGLVSVFISTWLLPVPSVVSAMRMLLSGTRPQSNFSSGNGSEWSTRKVFCVLALYALKYPRKPFAPSALSPAKKSNPLGVFSPESAKKPFHIISPNSTPKSKSGIFSPGQSLAFSQSKSSQYPPSPLSSPSRVIRYSMPPKGGSSEGGINASISSSMSTIPPTPSPSTTLASAYRGKHASSFQGGRPMDGLFLSQMTGDDDEEE
ncbi:hypothetical protein J3R30DRAFT_682907 [Lentinula aciculospora]|uniref:Uncharacterized protein n=1 Tax=Lentinula aciculospora TaxID=153920 RepID=A0A9W9A4R4_9AGAR|nr:hypothetical protein J3R30DRAFT_682907 [Lentinula aciculospora]